MNVPSRAAAAARYVLERALIIAASVAVVSCDGEVSPSAAAPGPALQSDYVIPPEPPAHMRRPFAAKQPVTLYLDFDGAIIAHASYDDSAKDQSFIGTGGTIPSFIGDRSAVLAYVRKLFSPYPITVVAARPSSAPYTEVVIGGRRADLGYKTSTNTVVGVAPVDCDNSYGRHVGFTFADEDAMRSWRKYAPSRYPAVVATVTAHEAAHIFGLEHTTTACDMMSYASCKPEDKKFFDQTMSLRSTSHCGRTSQNSHQQLLDALTVPQKTCAPTVTRVSGASRFATAAAVSRARGGTASTVIIASGEGKGSPDALTAGPLVAKLGARLLLTRKDALPKPTVREMTRLKASAAIVVGGKAVVQPSVVTQLEGLGLSVRRIAGNDRFATAARIAREVKSPAHVALVASGTAMADALAASPVAAYLRAPLLLVTRDAVPSATRDAIKALGVSELIVIGGKGVISDAVYKALHASRRVAGRTRYDTAAAVSRFGVARGMSISSAYLVRGDLFIDAMAAGGYGRAILLTPSNELAAPAKALLGTSVKQVTIVGGTGAVSGWVQTQTCTALGR